MKTTIELPENLLRRAKIAAAEEGRSLKDCFEEALQLWLTQRGMPKGRPGWMSGFGGLRHLHEETVQINEMIDRDFGKVDDDVWA